MNKWPVGGEASMTEAVSSIEVATEFEFGQPQSNPTALPSPFQLIIDGEFNFCLLLHERRHIVDFELYFGGDRIFWHCANAHSAGCNVRISTLGPTMDEDIGMHYCQPDPVTKQRLYIDLGTRLKYIPIPSARHRIKLVVGEDNYSIQRVDRVDNSIVWCCCHKRRCHAKVRTRGGSIVREWSEHGCKKPLMLDEEALTPQEIRHRRLLFPQTSSKAQVFIDSSQPIGHQSKVEPDTSNSTLKSSDDYVYATDEEEEGVPPLKEEMQEGGELKKEAEYLLNETAGCLNLICDGGLYEMVKSPQDPNRQFTWFCIHRDKHNCSARMVTYDGALTSQRYRGKHYCETAMNAYNAMLIRRLHQNFAQFRYWPTARGNAALCYDGFRYTFDRVRFGGVVHWRCYAYGDFKCPCRVRMHTQGARVVAFYNEHVCRVSLKQDERNKINRAIGIPEENTIDRKRKPETENPDGGKPEYLLDDDGYLVLLFEGHFFEVVQDLPNGNGLVSWRCVHFADIDCKATVRTMNGNVTERNGQHHMRCDTLDNSNYAFLSSGKPNAIYWPTDEGLASLYYDGHYYTVGLRRAAGRLTWVCDDFKKANGAPCTAKVKTLNGLVQVRLSEHECPGGKPHPHELSKEQLPQLTLRKRPPSLLIRRGDTTTKLTSDQLNHRQKTDTNRTAKVSEEKKKASSGNTSAEKTISLQCNENLHSSIDDSPRKIPTIEENDDKELQPDHEYGCARCIPVAQDAMTENDNAADGDGGQMKKKMDVRKHPRWASQIQRRATFGMERNGSIRLVHGAHQYQFAMVIANSPSRLQWRCAHSSVIYCEASIVTIEEYILDTSCARHTCNIIETTTSIAYMVPPITGTMRYIPNRRGSVKLVVDGYHYLADNPLMVERYFSWRCGHRDTTGRCRARIFTTQLAVAQTFREHNHEPMEDPHAVLLEEDDYGLTTGEMFGDFIGRPNIRTGNGNRLWPSVPIMPRLVGGALQFTAYRPSSSSALSGIRANGPSPAKIIRLQYPGSNNIDDEVVVGVQGTNFHNRRQVPFGNNLNASRQLRSPVTRLPPPRISSTRLTAVNTRHTPDSFVWGGSRRRQYGE